MEHVVHPVGGPFGHGRIGEITFEEIDARNVIEIATVAGGEVVDDADAVAAANQLFGEMRADESCAAGNEVRRHIDEVTCKKRCSKPVSRILSAFPALRRASARRSFL